MQYINWFEFLVKELECRIELSHLMSIVEWFMAFNEMQGEGLASSHEIFKDRTLASLSVDDSEWDANRLAMQSEERISSARKSKRVRWQNEEEE